MKLCGLTVLAVVVGRWVCQDPQAEEVLYRCIARAGEQRLRHLRSMAALSLASFEAMGGAGFQQQTLSMDGREVRNMLGLGHGIRLRVCRGETVVVG